MITRMRSRLQSLQAMAMASQKLDPQATDAKTTKSVCLLSVILLLPYLCRLHSNELMGSVGVVYSVLVIPLLISANYNFPVKVLKDAGLRCMEFLKRWSEPMKRFLNRIYKKLDSVERYFTKLGNVFNMVNQMIFFTLCDRVIVPGQRATCLYSLLFYNVIAYCLSYINELISKEDWSPYVNMAHHSNIRHLAMSSTKIVLEWTKAVTFIVTVVFMLLVFGLEEGLEQYHPTWTYTVVTGVYYVVTAETFVEKFTWLLSALHLELLESLETLWSPVILETFTCSLSFIVSLPLLMFGHFKLFLLALYANVYLRYKVLASSNLQTLNAERTILTQYRVASKEEVDEHDDVCAVCLNTMTYARITPCQHLFHADCLRQCLKSSDHCPICKREFKFD